MEVANDKQNDSELFATGQQNDVFPDHSTSGTELSDALGCLEERLKTPLVLHYVEGFSTKEIAEILGIPQGTVKTRMMFGRQELRHLLGRSIEEHGAEES
jgi:RNA polymerase sigma factor (sigma-70 family)